MSIASEITSMGENLKKDYQSIANLGADLTNVDKNIENIAELLDNVYDVLPKTSFQEGTDVTIENGLKGKIDFDDGKVGFGQASQESTQGYNLLPFPVATSGVVSGVTHSSQNGVYTMKGTSTATSTRLDYNIEGYTIKSGDYLHLLSNITSNNCSFALLESSTSQITFVSPTSTERIVDLSSFAGKTITVVRTFFNGTTIDITMKPMITNSNQSQQFEKYTGGYASPSPNWQQPIQCVTGNQEIVESGKNIFEPVLKIDNTEIAKHYCTMSVVNQVLKFISTGGDMYFGDVSPANSTYNKGKGVKIYRNGNAKLSFKMSNSLINKNYITAYNSSGVSLGYSSTLTDEGTYTFPTDCEYVTFRIGRGNTTSGEEFETTIMVAYGDTIPDYEPYHTPITYPISLGDIELNAIGNYKDELIYDVDEDKVYKNKAIGKVVLNGSENLTLYNSGTDNWYYRATLDTDVGTNLTSATAYCSHYPINNIGNSNTLQGLQIIASVQQLRIRYGTEDTIANFKDWLASNNVTILYQLQTALKEEITGTLKDQIKALYNSQSFTGTTIIESNGDLPMIIKVRALKGE